MKTFCAQVSFSRGFLLRFKRSYPKSIFQFSFGVLRTYCYPFIQSTLRGAFPNIPSGFCPPIVYLRPLGSILFLMPSTSLMQSILLENTVLTSSLRRDFPDLLGKVCYWLPKAVGPRDRTPFSLS